MSVYDSEEEQVEALKKWWSENGKSIFGGVVLGLGAVFGWQAWTQHQGEIAAQASLRYDKMAQAAQLGNTESALKQGEKIIDEWPDSSYAALARLDMARMELEQGNADAARTHYAWVMTNAQDPSLQQLARLRQARMLLGEKDIDAAESLVAQADKDNFAGEFAALRGDIARAKKDYAAARTAYLDAMNQGVGNPGLIQMKLDDLAAVEAEK